MQTLSQTERRIQRAESIPLDSIKPDGNGGYWVPSSDGKRSYYVTASSCSCPDRAPKCKHRLAVELLCPPSRSVVVADPFEGFDPEPSALERELAELEARRGYYEKRLESANRGYSGRFSSLDAQKYRHKIARIQERQIQIRELLK